MLHAAARRQSVEFQSGWTSLNLTVLPALATVARVTRLDDKAAHEMSHRQRNLRMPRSISCGS